MISAKLKIIGVAPEAVSRLHEALKASFELPGNLKFNTNGCPKTVPHAYIEESKFSPDHGTYTVFLSLNLSESCGENGERPSHDRPDYIVRLSGKSLQHIFQAVDPNLLPDEEVPVPADDASKEILRKREVQQTRNRADQEIANLYAMLAYKPLPCDVKNLDGRVIVEARTDVTHDHLWTIRHWNMDPPVHNLRGDYLDLESVADKKVKALLRQAREMEDKLDDMEKSA